MTITPIATSVWISILNVKQAAERDFQLALALHSAGRLAEAEQAYRLVLKSDPDHFNALNNLGLVLFRQNNARDAISHTRRAANLDPSNAETQSNLGNMLGKTGEHTAALRYFEKSLAIAPANVRTLARYIATLRAKDRQSDALPALENAARIKPADPDIQHMLGSLLYGVGRIGEARQAFEAAIRIKPNGHYYRDLIFASKLQPRDPAIAAMEQLLRQSPVLPADERMALHFALGKVFADIGSHARSFEHQLNANRIRRGLTSYDEVAARAQIESLISQVGMSVVNVGENQGIYSALPIFIVGMPRSGSTLIEQILASHPDVGTMGESLALENFAQAHTGLMDPAQITLTATSEQVHAIGADYLSEIRQAWPDAKRVVNKMLPNFLFVGLIRRAFPKARIVHVVRNAIDTCLSCFSIEFPEGAAYLYDLGELGRYYRAYAELMEHWRSILPQGVMLDLKYEELVANPEQQIRRLLDHCGLNWDPVCLDFAKSERPVWTASATQVREPIHTNSVRRWRPDEITLSPLLDALGKYAG